MIVTLLVTGRDPDSTFVVLTWFIRGPKRLVGTLTPGLRTVFSYKAQFHLDFYLRLVLPSFLREVTSPPTTTRT